MTKQNIKFKSIHKKYFEIDPKPYPASKAIPDWWKNSTAYSVNPDNPEGKKILFNNNIPNFGFKKCVPMLDGLTSGYMIPLWSDVYVSCQNNCPVINWKSPSSVFELHGSDSQNIEAPDGYSNKVVKYLNRWIVQTPKGYSSLILPPIGYKNLPLKAIPAVIDTDKTSIDLPFPMWVKDNFTGIVEKGTPLVQIIPFKRTNWESSFDYFVADELEIIVESGFKSTLFNHYTKNIWNKKDYK
jgi:hypothetical protein